MRRKVNPEEVVQYRIETRAEYEEIAKHFKISRATVENYIREVKENNPELKENLEQKRRKASPEEVVEYKIESRASDKMIAEHFKISRATVDKYKREVKENNPELKEKLEQIKTRGKQAARKASPEEVAKYRIETRATYKETAKHFEISKAMVERYIKEVKDNNPELKEKLEQIRMQQIRMQRSKKASPEEVAKYRIETRATYKETAKYFGISLATVTNYIREVKENNPDLIKQLEQAKQNKHEAFERVKQENADLKAENTNLKARIVLLEQELKAYREGLVNVANGISNEHEEAETQMPEGKEIDVVLRAFDSGKISNQDALILQNFMKKLMEQKAKLEKARKEDNLLSYTTMISAIRTLLSTHKPEYIQKSAELRKFISPEYYGPLYEIQDNMPIAKLISQIKNSTGMDVSSIEIALIINELNKEGQSNKVSDKINAEFIGRLRSRIESCNDKIEQETLTLAGGKNDNEEVR